jgi:hypothetical protein
MHLSLKRTRPELRMAAERCTSTCTQDAARARAVSAGRNRSRHTAAAAEVRRLAHKPCRALSAACCVLHVALAYAAPSHMARPSAACAACPRACVAPAALAHEQLAGSATRPRAAQMRGAHSPARAGVFVRACVRACVPVCVHACERAYVRACVPACLRACVPTDACVRACVRECS